MVDLEHDPSESEIADTLFTLMQMGMVTAKAIQDVRHPDTHTLIVKNGDDITADVFADIRSAMPTFVWHRKIKFFDAGV